VALIESIFWKIKIWVGISLPPLPLRVTKEDPAHSPLLSGGGAGRRGRGCTSRDVNSRSRPSFRFPLVESGVMPSWSSSWVLPSGALGVCLVLILLRMLRWSEIKATEGSAAMALPNKLISGPDLVDLATPIRSSSGLCGGERRVDVREFDNASGSSSSSAICWLQAALLSNPLAERQLLQDRSLECWY
jgi:hypothetical protein